MEIKVSPESGRVPVTLVHVEGKIDASTADAFLAEVTGLINNGTKDVLVDMSHVPYMSSAGLRSLHDIFNQLRAANNETDGEEMRKGIGEGTYKSPHLKLLNLSEDTRTAFETAGFDMYIQTFTDRQEAINSF
jgi:anti-anti-sigma factor